jgi:hypothetical protein
MQQMGDHVAAHESLRAGEQVSLRHDLASSAEVP